MQLGVDWSFRRANYWKAYAVLVGETFKGFVYARSRAEAAAKLQELEINGSSLYGEPVNLCFISENKRSRARNAVSGANVRDSAGFIAGEG